MWCCVVVAFEFVLVVYCSVTSAVQRNGHVIVVVVVAVVVVVVV